MFTSNAQRKASHSVLIVMLQGNLKLFYCF